MIAIEYPKILTPVNSCSGSPIYPSKTSTMALHLTLITGASRGMGLAMAEQLLHRVSAYLRTLENLLEQPRYLMMAVMATFVVIL